MHPTTKSRLRQVNHLPYLGWVREQLCTTKSSVRRWVDWNPDLDHYEAFYHTRQVTIPVPECEWSFLVCLHEIGHLSTGDRSHSYLSEYNAEQWAIKRAYERYGVHCPSYIEDAKRYVHSHILQNVLYYGLQVEKIKPYVLDWVGITAEQVLDELQECAE
jgi:hypothetical protein